MNWELVGWVITIVCVIATIVFTVMSIYSLGKIHGLKEAAKHWDKHFGNELRW